MESRIINLLHFQTLIASKAARSVLVAPEKLLVDFGLRRAHGAEAGMLAARASYLAGYSGTATVLAGAQFGIPLYGAMAHSYIQAHANETDAFERFARSHPTNAVLLIDTYDTEAAAEKVVKLAPRLQQQGIHKRHAGGAPLIQPFMQAGERLAAPEPLEESRRRAAAELARLPEHLKQLETAKRPYTVEIAPALRQLAEAVDRTAH